MLPRRLTENGRHGKVFGSKDLFCSCFELSGDLNTSEVCLTSNNQSLSEDSQSATEHFREPNKGDDKVTVPQRRAISLIQDHSNIIGSLQHSQDDSSKDVSSTKAKVDS